MQRRVILMIGFGWVECIELGEPSHDFGGEYVRGVIASSVDGRNSMTIDLAARLKTEIDYINGAIVAAGRRTGTPTPYNEAILRLVKAKENVPRE